MLCERCVSVTKKEAFSRRLPVLSLRLRRRAFDLLRIGNRHNKTVRANSVFKEKPHRYDSVFGVFFNWELSNRMSRNFLSLFRLKFLR